MWYLHCIDSFVYIETGKNLFHVNSKFLSKYFHYKNVNIRFNDNRISKFLREKSNETANAQYWRIKQRDISKTMHFPETLLKKKKKEKLLFFDEEYNVYSTYIGYPEERERGARL